MTEGCFCAVMNQNDIIFHFSEIKPYIFQPSCISTSMSFILLPSLALPSQYIGYRSHTCS